MRLRKWNWMLWLDNCPFASRYASETSLIGNKISENYGFFVMVMGGWYRNSWWNLAASHLDPANSGQGCSTAEGQFKVLLVYKHPCGFWRLRQSWALQQHARQQDHHPFMARSEEPRRFPQAPLASPTFKEETRMSLGASLAGDSNALLRFKHTNSSFCSNWITQAHKCTASLWPLKQFGF